LPDLDLRIAFKICGNGCGFKNVYDYELIGPVCFSGPITFVAQINILTNSLPAVTFLPKQAQTFFFSSL
jgi:hypothetical protein